MNIAFELESLTLSAAQFSTSRVFERDVYRLPDAS